MKRIISKIVLYQCSICKTKYSNKKEAFRCKKRIREKKVFRMGHRVVNLEQRFCQTKRRYYFFSGKIIRILGPKPSDYEYETKWLSGKKERINGHIFQYEVGFHCPQCKEKRQELYYAPELKLINR